MSQARLAVVVCTYNRAASLMQTLDSLESCGTPSEPVDLLVVPNHCTDDTLARLANRSAAAGTNGMLRLNWVEQPVPGKSHALNLAIEHTRHEALCFIDDDQVVEAGFVANLLQALDDHPGADILCGRIWPAWDGSEPAWVHAKPPYAIPIRPFPEFDLGPQSRTLAPDERLPSGGNITVRRRVFDKVGRFSAELGPSGHNLAGGEDHDFLQRAVDAGFTIRYVPTVRQLHAIDSERTSTRYILRKSFLRSRSSFLVDPPVQGPRPYMLRKIAAHAFRVATSLQAERRFHAMVRLAASVGELSAARALARGRRGARGAA